MPDTDTPPESPSPLAGEGGARPQGREGEGDLAAAIARLRAGAETVERADLEMVCRAAERATETTDEALARAAEQGRRRGRAEGIAQAAEIVDRARAALHEESAIAQGTLERRKGI